MVTWQTANSINCNGGIHYEKSAYPCAGHADAAQRAERLRRQRRCLRAERRGADEVHHGHRPRISPVQLYGRRRQLHRLRRRGLPGRVRLSRLGYGDLRRELG